MTHLTAERYRQMLAGERCGCGHHVRSHEPPAPGDAEDVKTGPCRVKSCGCQGYVHLTEWEDKDDGSEA